MKTGLLILAGALMMLAPMSASAALGVRGVAFAGGPGWGGWDGGWYGPYWGPYWGTPYPVYAYPNAGEVKLETEVKTAQVYIDGSYAGTTHQNKEMYLKPGSYDIKIVEGGKVRFSQRVYVVIGKKLKLFPEL
jgi:PEGA domain